MPILRFSSASISPPPPRQQRTMAASGIVDPTKPGKYPVILSDALLGKPSKEAYTAIRYNHRPTLSSETAPNTARLKKSGNDGSYNLGFDDQGNKYQYNGARTTDDGNYALIFDPARKAFVLHRIDSTFHMNLTRTPTETNAESLRKQFPQLEVKTGTSSKPQKGKGTTAAAEKSQAGSGSSKATPANKATSNTSKATTKSGTGKTDNSSSKPDNKTKQTKSISKSVALTLPSAPPPQQQQQQQQQKQQQKRAQGSDDEDEDDDDDADDVLTVEYPGGNPSSFQPPVSRAPPVAVTRRWSEFAREMQSETDDEGDEMMADADASVGLGLGLGIGAGAGREAEEEGYGGEEEGYEEEGYEEEGYEEEEEEEEEEDDEGQQGQGQGMRGLHGFGGSAAAAAANPVAVEPEVYTFDAGSEDGEGAEGDEDFGDLEADLEAEMLKEFDKVQDEGHESEVSEEE